MTNDAMPITQYLIDLSGWDVWEEAARREAIPAGHFAWKALPLLDLRSISLPGRKG